MTLPRAVSQLVSSKTTSGIGDTKSTIGENRQPITDEPVEFEK